MNTNPNDETPPGEADAAALFEVLWEALADMLGPATTATLLRRSAKYAAARQPTLAGVVIRREGFEYRYELPAAWRESPVEATAALRALLGELWRLLVPLTDHVVVRRLEAIDALRRSGIVPPEVHP